MKLVTAASGRRRLLVIHNPTAGRARRRRLDATLEALELLGCTTALRPTRRAGDGEVLAREVCPDDGDLVIAAGGDGTINEVVNGLLATRPNGGALPLAILPLGTANVLANELGLDSTPDTLARAIASGPIQPIALGRAGQRYFVSMAGVGFDAHVVASVNLDLKRRIGKAAYVLESLRQLATFPFPGYRLSIDGHKRVVASAIVTRGRYYGGPYLCAAEGRHSPSVVASLHFRTVGAWNAARYGAMLTLGRLPRLPDYRIEPAESIAIEGPHGDPVQGDGDLIGHLPLTIALAPNALRLVVPNR